MMCVAAVSSIPSFDFVHVFPPSSLRQTPPLYVSSDVCRHIFGRGRSWVPLFTLHMRPRTFGSKTTQYVVFSHASGTPNVELCHDFPPSSLRKRPISVYVTNRRFESNGSK